MAFNDNDDNIIYHIKYYRRGFHHVFNSKYGLPDYFEYYNIVYKFSKSLLSIKISERSSALSFQLFSALSSLFIQHYAHLPC